MDRTSKWATIAGSRHWVFDLDGTLTVAMHDFVEIRRILGVPEGVDILGHLDMLPEEQGVVARGRLLEIEEEIAGRAERAVGALELLQLLHERGVTLGVLTRNARDIALRTLSRIGLSPYIAPQHVLGRDEAVAKPDPDGIFKLALSWGMPASALVMVGDYSFDLATGRAAGAATVHVDPSRSFRWPELTDVAVGTLAELALALA